MKANPTATATPGLDPSDLALFAAACRENTGRHVLDSGSAYGRHWEQPAIDVSPEAPEVTVSLYGNGADGKPVSVSACVETAHLLAGAFTLDRRVQRIFDRWAARKTNADLDWFAAGDKFCREVLRLNCHARDNVYNGENDLSQVYVWEVWTGNERESDWIYADDPLTVLYVHTGCDVRGGYGRPLFCRSNGEFAVPVDLCAEFRAIEGTDANGAPLDWTALETVSEKWQSGYSRHPSGEVERALARVLVFPGTGEGESGCPAEFVAVLHTGETVRIAAGIPCFG